MAHWLILEMSIRHLLTEEVMLRILINNLIWAKDLNLKLKAIILKKEGQRLKINLVQRKRKEANQRNHLSKRQDNLYRKGIINHNFLNHYQLVDIGRIISLSRSSLYKILNFNRRIIKTLYSQIYPPLLETFWANTN